MDQAVAHSIVSHQHAHSDWPLHFFLGLHSKLKHYGSWIQPVQHRLHISTVRCLIDICNSF